MTDQLPVPAGDAQRRLGQVQRLANLLDASFRIPGTQLRFGIDALIGLVPGFGDAFGIGFSSYILWQAYRIGASKRLLARMLYNVGIDGLLGAIPLLGDWHDFVWKANVKNATLLERQVADPDGTARASGWFFVAVFGTLAGFGVAAMVLAIWALRQLLGLIG